MKAAWYERQGPAADVLETGEIETPTPAAGEVRLKVMVSGINPGDTKKRDNYFGYGMAYPRVIPHSDGAGIIDEVGAGVSGEWVGRRVWCFGAQSYRAFGTAAEYVVLPLEQVVPMPDAMTFEQGACLGIPALTAYQAVHAAGLVEGKTVLVQGGAGAVGLSAVQLAHRAGARVIATVRRDSDIALVKGARADEVVLMNADNGVEVIQGLAPDGVDHIVEVAFAANIETDKEVLAVGGSICSYATDKPNPELPFWELLFKNTRIFLIGSDDFPMSVKQAAAQAINGAYEAGWSGYEIAARFPLTDIARAHELVDKPVKRGRVVVL